MQCETESATKPWVESSLIAEAHLRSLVWSQEKGLCEQSAHSFNVKKFSLSVFIRDSSVFSILAHYNSYVGSGSNF